MACGKTHAVLGGVTGVSIYGIYKYHKKENWTFLGVTGAAIIGTVMALLPDIIESAKCNPNHRQFFHSVIILLSAILAYNKIGRNEFEKLLTNVGLAGYASHLFLDALTPRSLPLA